MNLFVLAQICGAIVLIFTVISVHFKTKEKIVMCSILANLFATIQFFLLGALTGAVVSVLNTIRCLIFYFYKRKGLKPSVMVLLIFEIIAIISGTFSWQNMWSLIPIVVTVIYTYGLWQDNVKIIRMASGVVGFGWAIYDLVVMAYVGAIQETSQLVSSIIALYRNRKKKNIILTGTVKSGLRKCKLLDEKSRKSI